MNPNSQEIVQQIQAKFNALLASVTKKEDDCPTLYQIECNLLAQLLEIAKMLVLTFILTQQERLKDVKTVTINAKVLPLHATKRRTLRSLFGRITFQRNYYYTHQEGYFLLDATLQLPDKSLSYLLREFLGELSCYLPYLRSGGILQRMVQHQPPSHLIQETLREDSKYVEAFSEQLPPLDPATEAPLLIAQADGKGVPMLPDSPQKERVRLGKGEKLGKKKEAIVTSVYTLKARVRTPEEVVRSLFKKKQPPVLPLLPLPRGSQSEHTPKNKRLWATLGGKEAALSFTAEQVAKREGEHIVERVALRDGSEALQTKMQSSLPTFTLVLDIIHAVEYLWEAGNSLYGEESGLRESWVELGVLLLLKGKVGELVKELRELSLVAGCKASTGVVLKKVAGYYERNRSYMC